VNDGIFNKDNLLNSISTEQKFLPLSIFCSITYASPFDIVDIPETFRSVVPQPNRGTPKSASTAMDS
jgi:hypothetical protein